MDIPSNAKIPAPRMARPSFSEDMVVIGRGGLGKFVGVKVCLVQQWSGSKCKSVRMIESPSRPSPNPSCVIYLSTIC